MRTLRIILWRLSLKQSSLVAEGRGVWAQLSGILVSRPNWQPPSLWYRRALWPWPESNLLWMYFESRRGYALCIWKRAKGSVNNFRDFDKSSVRINASTRTCTDESWPHIPFSWPRFLPLSFLQPGEMRPFSTRFSSPSKLTWSWARYFGLPCKLWWLWIPQHPWNTLLTMADCWHPLEWEKGPPVRLNCQLGNEKGI